MVHSLIYLNITTNKSVKFTLSKTAHYEFTDIHFFCVSWYCCIHNTVTIINVIKHKPFLMTQAPTWIWTFFEFRNLWWKMDHPFTLRKELSNPLLLQSHRTFVYLQRNIVNNNKVSSFADMPSCVPFVFTKGIIGVYCPLGKTKWFSQHDFIF